MTDLDLVPTEDLLKALRARYDHMVFAGIEHMGVDRLRVSRIPAFGSILSHFPPLDP